MLQREVYRVFAALLDGAQGTAYCLPTSDTYPHFFTIEISTIVCYTLSEATVACYPSTLTSRLSHTALIKFAQLD